MYAATLKYNKTLAAYSIDEITLDIYQEISIQCGGNDFTIYKYLPLVIAT